MQPQPPAGGRARNPIPIHPHLPICQRSHDAHIRMSNKSTIFKAQLQIADIDHGYYADHALTLARHPSETDERMMVRLAALALQAHQLRALCAGDGVLAFGAGLSDPQDPDVALTDFTGRKRLWIEVGQPQEKALTRACSKADAVLVYCFSHAAETWWKSLAQPLARLTRLQVWRIPTDASRALAQLAERSMQLQATVQQAGMTLGNAQESVTLEPLRWK